MSTVTTVVKFSVKLSFQEEMRSNGLSYAEYTRRHTPGCLAFHVTVDPDNPEWMLFIEIWESKAAFDYHLCTDSFHKMATIMASRCNEIHVLLTKEIENSDHKALTSWM